MKSILIVLAILITCQFLSAQYDKMDYWYTGSFFTGFNMSSWDNKDSLEVSLQDFVDLKNIGANLVNIQMQGFYEVEAPYAKKIWYEEAGDTTFYSDILDMMVEYANEAELYYVISVRSGPGRIDVSVDTGGSTIWLNEEEQRLFAAMCREMTQKYIADPLFVGIDPLLEPNPLVQYGEPTLEEEIWLLDTFSIDVYDIYRQIIDSIRMISTDLPIMIEGVYYSNPEYFSITEKMNDGAIVYKAHLYAPSDFTHALEPWSTEYPGVYWSARLNDERTFDFEFLEEELFSPVIEFQQEHNVPIYVGETGIFRPQFGAMKFLTDVISISCNYGWHYAFWIFNDGPEFNYQDLDEKYGTHYWDTIPQLLNCGMTTQAKNLESQNPISIIPNPAGDFIEIQSEGIRKGTMLTIIDIHGVELIGTKLDHFSKSININNLSPGCYFLRLSDSLGNHPIEKFIKL